MSTPTPPPPRIARNEAFAAFGLACLLLGGAVLLGVAVPFVQSNLGFIAALIFLFVPSLFLKRHGERDIDYGLALQLKAYDLRWAVGSTLLTLLFFLPAYHLWSTKVADQSAFFSTGNYLRAGERFMGQPASTDDGRVHIWTWGTQLVVDWTPQSAPFTLDIEGDGQENGGLATTPADYAQGNFVPRIVREGSIPRPQRVVLQSTGVRELTIQATSQGQAVAGEDYVAGAGARALETSPNGGARVPLGWGWLFTVLLTQLILVAIPEEFFFRGFVQTRLHQAWGESGWNIAGLTLTKGIVVSSLLFALSHLFVGFGVHRLAVFFPSLLFGALRQKTGGIAAPVLYHAACNLMVLLMSVHYF